MIIIKKNPVNIDQVKKKSLNTLNKRKKTFAKRAYIIFTFFKIKNLYFLYDARKKTSNIKYFTSIKYNRKKK